MQRPVYSGSIDFDVAMEEYHEATGSFCEELDALRRQIEELNKRAGVIRSAASHVSDCSDDDESTLLDMFDVWDKLGNLQEAMRAMTFEIRQCYYTI